MDVDEEKIEIGEDEVRQLVEAVANDLSQLCSGEPCDNYGTVFDWMSDIRHIDGWDYDEDDKLKDVVITFFETSNDGLDIKVFAGQNKVVGLFEDKEIVETYEVRGKDKLFTLLELSQPRR